MSEKEYFILASIFLKKQSVIELCNLKGHAMNIIHYFLSKKTFFDN